MTTMKRFIIASVCLFLSFYSFSETEIFIGGKYINTARKNIMNHGIGADVSFIFSKNDKTFLFAELGFDYDLTPMDSYKSESLKKDNIKDFTVYSFSVPITFGYPFDFQLNRKLSFLLVPAFRYTYTFFNQFYRQYDTFYLSGFEDYYVTKVWTKRNIHQFDSVLNVSFVHSFGKVKLRYGIDVDIPLFTKEEYFVEYKGYFQNGSETKSGQSTVFSDFTIKTSPFVSLGFYF